MDKIKRVSLENMPDRNPRLQLGSVLYIGGADGSLKSFNLLGGADAFGTERNAGSSQDYYLYMEDAKGCTINVLDSAGFRVIS